MLPANCWASLRCAYWGKLPGNAQWKVQHWAKFPTAVFLFGITGGVTVVEKLRVGRQFLFKEILISAFESISNRGSEEKTLPVLFLVFSTYFSLG